MANQVTLTLPDELLQRASYWASSLGKPVQEILTDAIEHSLRPLGANDGKKPMADWPDEEILQAADMTLASEEDERLSALLFRQQAGLLTGPEQAELQGLMEVYQGKLLGKATALREAVHRGLREPLQP